MNLTWGNPPAHHWYAAKSPGLSIQCRSSRAHQTALAHLRSGHLRSMTFVQGGCNNLLVAKFGIGRQIWKWVTNRSTLHSKDLADSSILSLTLNFNHFSKKTVLDPIMMGSLEFVYYKSASYRNQQFLQTGLRSRIFRMLWDKKSSFQPCPVICRNYESGCNQMEWTVTRLPKGLRFTSKTFDILY
ncbi:uncharacterized protein TNCV_3971811 [Trichonephila clavipes]|nr:uncharacterized protein TNCV_3971811 [Trichonephila clavipes]